MVAGIPPVAPHDLVGPYGVTRLCHVKEAHEEHAVVPRDIPVELPLASWGCAIADVLHELMREHLKALACGNVKDLAGVSQLYDRAIQPGPLYTLRILQQTQHCSFSCRIVALLYVQRLLTCRPCLFVNDCTIYRLYAIAFVLAIKFVDDAAVYCGPTFAALVGCNSSTLSYLEAFLFARVQFRLSICSSSYDHMYRMVLRRAVIHAGPSS